MIQPVVAVTAASGKTGSAVVRELRLKGLPVRALVRKRDARSEALARLGAEVIETDLYCGEAMATALKGVRRAYYCPPLGPHTLMTLAAFLYAAEVVRLESVAAMTQRLASPNHPTLMTRDMWLVEQLLPTLKGAGVTILNPGFFADNYLRVSKGPTRRDQKRSAPTRRFSKCSASSCWRRYGEAMSTRPMKGSSRCPPLPIRPTRCRTKLGKLITRVPVTMELAPLTPGSLLGRTGLAQTTSTN